MTGDMNPDCTADMERRHLEVMQPWTKMEQG